MTYTEVFLNKFLTGDNAVTWRQMMGLSIEEVNYMIAEINEGQAVSVAVKNDVDAVDNSFSLQLDIPADCPKFDALKFLFYNVNQGTYGTTAAITEPADEGDTDGLDSSVIITYTPV